MCPFPSYLCALKLCYFCRFHYSEKFSFLYILLLQIRMLKSLESLQYGFETPKSFQACVTNHRIVNLALSSHSKLEQFHTGGINTLDIDKVDER